MAAPFTLSITLRGETDPVDVQVAAVLVAGEIGAVPVAHVDFVSKDKAMDLESLVGTDGGFTLTGETGAKQQFWGTVVSAEALGVSDGMGRYLLELRPWPWFLTRARNNRIYQDMTAMEIVTDVLSAHGFSRDLFDQTTRSDAKRVYCTQYRETDFDFVARLLSEEGHYFYFQHGNAEVRMVVTDEASTHASATEKDVVPFRVHSTADRIERMHSWTASERVVTGKVTLRDYDFQKPSADLTVTTTRTTGAHSHGQYEAYHYPGLYDDTGAGDRKAAAMIETDASAFRTWRGAGDTILLFPGKLFTLKDHPRHTSAGNSTFLATQVSLFYRSDARPVPGAESVLQGMLSQAPETGAHVATTCTAVLKSQAYRAALVPPRPQIAGVQTAIVTAPNGEEIDVDKYGRIHVRFHWDRARETDAAATCWVRTMMPWTGKGWGMAAWPRAGQEVVIQFEEGNPDRPLCTGMLYNADTMPPYPLPGQSTRSGMKSNSSKGGGGYNELMFEDKKGKELVRLEAERDFTQVVQNAAHLRVGYAHAGDVTDAKAQDKRSMKVEVENHLDEIVETGNHSFTVKTGSQTLAIKTDKTETVEGDSTLTVTGDTAVTIKQGNLTETVDTGDVTRKLSAGNEKLTLSAGNYTMNAQAGKVDITAAQSITLTVGGNSIKIDQSGVTIKGLKVSLQGSVMLEAKAPMTEVKGDAALILKGGVTMIN